MLRNSTQKYKQTYQRNNLRDSTPRRIPIYYDTLYNTKPALKTETSLKAIKLNRSINKNLEFSRSKTKIQRNGQFTQRTLTQSDIESSLGNEYRQFGSIRQLLKNEDNQSMKKSISDLKWRPAKGSSLLQRQPRVFLQSLARNELFYCCKCYQYVFQVQKMRHFPYCKDQLFFVNYERQKILSLCWERLQKLKELSIYSGKKEREIKDLMHQVKTHQFHRILIINYPKDANFFTLEQIEQAFVYTYQNLLKGRIFKEKTHFFNFCL